PRTTTRGPGPTTRSNSLSRCARPEPAPRATSAIRTSGFRPLVDEAGDLCHHLRDRPRRGNVVERNRDVEAIFQFGDRLENLQRIEPEVGDQVALERGLERSATAVVT